MAKVGRNVLVACPDCDAVQHEPEGAAEHGCACWRCNAYLGPTHDQRLDFVLALAVTTLIAFAISLSFALVDINIQGLPGRATLVGAARALWSEGMQPVAVLVFFTTVAAPAVDLLALCYLLGGLYRCDRDGRRAPPRFAVATLRIAQQMRAWAMVEVFLLGTLVAVVRMTRESTVHVDIALWSLGAFVFLFIALSTAVHPRALWARLAAYGVVQ